MRSWLTCICQLKSNCSFAQLLPLQESGTIWSRGEQFTEDNSILRTKRRNPKRLACRHLYDVSRAKVRRYNDGEIFKKKFSRKRTNIRKRGERKINNIYIENLAAEIRLTTNDTQLHCGISREIKKQRTENSRTTITIIILLFLYSFVVSLCVPI